MFKVLSGVVRPATGCTTPPPAPRSASPGSSGCGGPSTCRPTCCAPVRSARSRSSRDPRREPCCGPGERQCPAGAAAAARAGVRGALEPVTQSDDEKLMTSLGRSSPRTPRSCRPHGRRDDHARPRRHPRRRRRRAARPRVRRARHDLAGADRVPRDDRRPAEAEGKLKKQSGGHGQFAVVQLRVSPMPPGGGFEFVDSVVGGAVPRTYIPAVERGRMSVRGRRAAGASGRRRARRAGRRQVALGGLLRDGVPHGGVDRGEGGARRGRYRACSNPYRS